MNHHLSVCAAKAGVTYSFDNGKIIDYQDNYKFMGDIPFSVYFDFDTTTGSVVFFLCKNECGQLLYNNCFSQRS